jgi:hypothetical protein
MIHKELQSLLHVSDRFLVRKSDAEVLNALSRAQGSGPGALKHFDFIGGDGKVDHFHDGVLRHLLGVVGSGLASQDQAVLLDYQAESADPAQQSPLKMSLKLV